MIESNDPVFRYAAQGHSLRITAPLELHRTALRQAAVLAAGAAGPAERKAQRVYAARITTAATAP